MRRGKVYEYQRAFASSCVMARELTERASADRLHCPRCQLVVGYETRPGEGQKGDATFLLPGELSFAPTRIQLTPNAQDP